MTDQDNTGDGGPAFGHAAYGPSDDFTGAPGMSLRDWFAGMALQGLVATGKSISLEADDIPEQVTYETLAARRSYKIADAMLKARQSCK